MWGSGGNGGVAAHGYLRKRRELMSLRGLGEHTLLLVDGQVLLGFARNERL